MQLRVLIHDPRHYLCIRAGVGSWHVAGGTKNSGDLVDERSRDQLQLVLIEIPGRTVDAALGAAERDVEECRLPCHQRRQRANLVEVDTLVVTDAALERPACPVVLDPITREHVDPGVVQPYRNLHLDLAIGRSDDGAEVLRDPEAIGRDVEVMRNCVKARRFRGPGVWSTISNSWRLVRMGETANRGMSVQNSRHHNRNR